MIKCGLCGRKFKLITNTHLVSIHNCNLNDYIGKFGSKNCGFLSPNLLSKNDPRYINWKKSLKKRPPVWSKGYTKETHPSLIKISETFKRKKIDNFAEWRRKMRREGRWIYSKFSLNGNLAELIGVILGDGYIRKYSRTEGLSISLNANNPGFVRRYAEILENLFNKKPHIAKIKSANCVRLRIYQNDISRRLKVPCGSRAALRIKIPGWILNNRDFLSSYLRGLYEAEGSFCVHKPTSTYKLLFSNRNKSLLQNVYRGLKILGFHPHMSQYKVQILRKSEVFKAKDLLKFRQY